MSRMLSLFDAGYSAAMALARAGRTTAARSALDAILGGPVSPADAGKARRTAAELAVRAGKYRTARRHLWAAARLSPEAADVHHALGRAFEDDPFGCDRRAARHYQKAVELDASTPVYKASLGRAMVRINELRSGVKVLRRAAETAPTDPDVLQIVAEGLREAGQSDVAFRVLSKARFLAPGDAGIRDLWVRAKFDLARQGQVANREADERQDREVIPMPKLFGTTAVQRTRTDHNTRPAAHVGRFRAFRTDRG